LIGNLQQRVELLQVFPGSEAVVGPTVKGNERSEGQDLVHDRGTDDDALAHDVHVRLDETNHHHLLCAVLVVATESQARNEDFDDPGEHSALPL
jgi:hypothetical protein